MARNWKDVRAQAVSDGTLSEDGIARAAEELRGVERAWRLAEVRKAHNVTQAELARAMGVAQPRVSAIERGALDRSEMGTLRAYVESLGGRLRVIADFDDQTLTLRG